MPKLLKVKPFKQSPSMCGPASLTMVLEYYGVEKSEAELAKLSGTTFKDGIEPTGIAKAADKLGFFAKVVEDGKIEDLKKLFRKKVPAIINWLSTDTGHYSVLVGIDKNDIYLQDPEIGRVRKMSLNTFESVWFGFKGGLPVMNKDLRLRAYIMRMRTYIAIKPK